MTYLGTRPPTVDEWELYEPHHRARMSFRPGLTLIETEADYDRHVNEKTRLSLYADFLYPLAEESTLEAFYQEKPEREQTVWTRSGQDRKGSWSETVGG